MPEHVHVYEPVIRRVPEDKVPAFELIVGYRCECGVWRRRELPTGTRENMRLWLRYVRERYGARRSRGGRDGT